jgi:LPXTG-motif cell wall-anchored protein
VKFPYELGNEFQGLGFEVEFEFIIEGYNPEDPEDPEEPENPTDPENPEDPEDPEDPEEPENPTDPENPEDPGDDGTILPERPIDNDDLNTPPVQGQILPETATNMYNYLFVGFFLVLIGAAALYHQRKNKTNDKYQA